jgi:hypothetical protein
MKVLGPDTAIFENIQEMNDWFADEYTLIHFGNIPENWQLEIANAYYVYHYGISDIYQEYLPLELWENPQFIYKAYKTIRDYIHLGKGIDSWSTFPRLDKRYFSFPGSFSKKVINSPEFLKIIKLSPEAITKVGMLDFTKDDFLDNVLKANWEAFMYCPPRVKKSYSCVLKAVLIEGSCLEHASSALKKEKAIIDAALNSNPHALKYIPKSIANQPSYYLRAIPALVRTKTWPQNSSIDRPEFHIYPNALNIYSNKQLEKMIVNFEDKLVRRVLWSLWCDRSLETDVLLIAKMKHRFLDTLETQ